MAVKPLADLPDNDDKENGQDDRPHKVRSTSSSSNKVLLESTNPNDVRKFVEDNYPRKHHEAEDHDVYVEHPDGSKHAYTAGDGDDGWSEYKTPKEREDSK